MKTISREEFRDAYMSPTEEQTARMQAKLDSLRADTEDRKHIRVSRPRMAFVMAAVLLVAGIITAVATTNLTRYATSWGGEVKEYEETAEDAAHKAWEEGIPEEMLEKMEKAYEEGYFTTLDSSQRGFSRLPKRRYESEAELIAALDAEGFPHPASLIPEGYSFVQGVIFLSARSGFDPDTCVGTMFRDGYSLYIYDVKPEDIYISDYNVVFTDEKDPDKEYHIDVNLTQSVEGFTYYFYTDEEYKSQILSVPGMEEAFSVRTQEEEKLYMYRDIREDPVYLAGKLTDQALRYQMISAGGPIDDIIRMYSPGNNPLN